jgi:hypothetical protein
VNRQAQRGAQRRLGLLSERLVEAAEDRGRPWLGADRHAGAVAHQRGHRRRGDALAGDIPDQREVDLLVRVELVEVTADIDSRLVLGREVQRGELPAGDQGQLAWAQTLLERLGDVRELRVQPRVLDRDGCAPGQLLGEFDVIVSEPPLRPVGGERQQPDRAVGDAHRDE